MVEMIDYDPDWPRQFAVLRDRLSHCVGELAIAVEHVGSTAVPGLAAKPVIDLDIVVASRADVPLVSARLSEIGYRHQGDLGIEDREAFKAPAGASRHHLYVCSKASLALWNHITLRDHLRQNPADRASYEALKRQLAVSCSDVDDYTRKKTEFILAILSRCNASEAALASIRDANLG